LVTRWLENSVARADNTSSKPKFSMVMPPPNVTGQLHMGHALNMTLQDAVARYKRKRGFDVLWLPGADHASIATHFVLERELEKEGKTRTSLGREEFLKRAVAWKEQSAGAIQAQLRRLGCTPDWSRERFTLDPGLTRAVMRTFVQLYREGLIYRGSRLVNWDPKFRTAISDLEVEQRDVEGSLWYIRYPLANDPQRFIIVATTRPETMFGDQAVAVNPTDPRYSDLIGQAVTLPLAGRTIPIIADEHADPEQGTGAVKITPAHDFNDYEVGLRHGLEQLDIMTPDARMNDCVPEAFRGLDRFEARSTVVAALTDAGLLEKIENKIIPQPFGDRSGVLIEPRLTEQWFLQTTGLAAESIERVENGKIGFVPPNWANVFFRWMRNIEPWCISRQLWYGHPIPAWYGPDDRIFVAETAEEAQADAQRHYGKSDVDLRQDTDILDTWFSSSLWPFATMGWPEQTTDLVRYYPTDLLVTGFDIIFFWVSKMIMQGIHLTQDVPFRTVYIHGLVRDAAGQKMSKTKGNVIDPLDLIDQHGADALRLTLLILCTHGQDLRFSVDAVRASRLFANKLWNAARFASLNNCVARPDFVPGSVSDPVNAWIIKRLGEVARETLTALDEFRFSEAALGLQSFIRDEFCDWYIEFAKIAFNGADTARAEESRNVAGWCLSQVCQLLNPFAPFVTEELWEIFGDGTSMSEAQFPDFDAIPRQADTSEVEFIIALVSKIRSVRNELKIPFKTPIPLLALSPSAAEFERLQRFSVQLRRLTNVSTIDRADALPPRAVRIIVNQSDLALVLDDIVDFEKERQRLEKAIARLDRDIEKIGQRLLDRNFLDRADADVIEQNRLRHDSARLERERLAEAASLL
jgi:valyl-tRNA synthetase